MAFCPQCGSEATGRFCPSCGASLGFAGAPAGTYSAASAEPISAAGLTDNVAAALCYLLGFVTGVIFLVLAPYNQNRLIRFHAFQSIFFHVASIIFLIGYGMFSAMLGLMTHHISTLITAPLWLLLSFGLFGTWLYLMYAAYTRKKVVLPLIGPLAEKQA